MYPLVEYAKSIGKNTAEFTTVDMVNFTKWWMGQPNKVQVESNIKAQLGRAQQIHNQSQLDKKEDKNMSRRYNTAAFQAAQTSRLAERGIESPINDGQEEIIIHEENEVVCSMDLTKDDVAALLFCIHRTFADYEMEGHEYQASLESLKVGLEGV